MPRGTIHQAKAAPNTHSLHITVSVGQRNCWADFLELAVPRALELASEDHLLLRETLPRGYADYMGVSHSDDHENPHRTAFIEKILECMNLVSQSIPWDSAADQLAVKFLQSRLPLPSHGHDEASSKASSLKATQKETISGDSKVALVAPGIARLVVEEDSAVVYHMLSNSRDLHNEGDDNSLEEEPSPQGRLAFSLDLAPALEELVVAYPEAVTISDLPVPKDEAVNLVSQLQGFGLLIVAS